MLYHNYSSAMLECNGNAKWKQFLLSALSSLLLLPSQSAGNTSPAQPGHSLTCPACLESRKGPQRFGSREIKEPSIWGEKEKGRGCSQWGHLKAVETARQIQWVWLVWANGDSPLERMRLQHSLPSPLSKHRHRRLQSISWEAGTALHPSAPLCCQGKNELTSNCRFGGESPGPAAGLCGVLHTLPVTPRTPEPITESLGWKRSSRPGLWHALNTQCVSLAASEPSWAQRWCLCRWLIHPPCCWWPGTLCQGIHQDPEQSTLPQTQRIQTGLLPHFLQTFCSLC